MESSNHDKRASRKPNQINYKDFNRMGIKDLANTDQGKHLSNGTNIHSSNKIHDPDLANGLANKGTH